MECDYLFNCASNPKITLSMMEKYCKTHPMQCARFKIRMSIGNEFLNPEILPVDNEKAKNIINHTFMHEEHRISTYY